MTKRISKFFVIALIFAIVISAFAPQYSNRLKDDEIVRQYLITNIEGGYSIWLVGSSRQNNSTRQYIFQVGAEGTLEIIVQAGEIDSSRWLRRIPHMWHGSDIRFNRNERWR
ncbi:MAG: hypothetical protein FWE32_02775 [Oscillospiraceae bacterium]|nr:hypothetical protein [Oscillospiraceae bacterium]